MFLSLATGLQKRVRWKICQCVTLCVATVPVSHAATVLPTLQRRPSRYLRLARCLGLLHYEREAEFSVEPPVCVL